MSRALLERIDELNEENRQLRAALLPEPVAAGYRGIRLTRQERHVLAALVASEGLTTHDKLVDRIELMSGRPTAGRKHLAVNICRLRKALAPAGIEIHTVWGDGYGLSDASRALLNARRCAP